MKSVIGNSISPRVPASSLERPKSPRVGTLTFRAIILLLAFAPACLAQLSGPLSGTLGPGEYQVVGNISVDEGDTLRLMPGTVFYFYGRHWFSIGGTLLAQGTIADSIIFTSAIDSVSSDSWRGLTLWGEGSSGSRLSYCEISRAYDMTGGGLTCGWCTPILEHCTICENTAFLYGGGVACIGKPSPTFINCDIRDNLAWVDDFVTSAGGVLCRRSSPTFIGCTISDNLADWSAGGIECFESYLTFIDCVISGNRARSNDGGGMICVDCSGSFTNCTITRNVGGAVFLYDSPLIFNSTTISFTGGLGIRFWDSDDAIVKYCNFFGNSSGDFVFADGDSSHGPPKIGIISTINANSDSCDNYNNIFLDPMFVDAEAGDFHLTESSPCINAGDPELLFDPDSTIADIGAFYYHQVATETPNVYLPNAYALHPNFPNPFNPTTTIRYDVKQAGQVQLTIFNLLGQKVASVMDRQHLPGSYTVLWNAAGLSSGVYLCRMEAGGFTQTRKLVLLK